MRRWHVVEEAPDVSACARPSAPTGRSMCAGSQLGTSPLVTMYTCRMLGMSASAWSNERNENSNVNYFAYNAYLGEELEWEEEQ